MPMIDIHEFKKIEWCSGTGEKSC